MIKNKKNLILATLFLAALLAAVLPELRHKPLTLLGRAHRVGLLGSWNPKNDNYFWLSNQKVLFITHSEQRDQTSAFMVQAQEIDIASSLKTENTLLEQALNKAEADDLVPQWQLSPDAKWLLANSNGLSAQEAWVATSLTGAQQVTRPYHRDGESNDYVSAVWRPNSRSWIQAEEDSNGKTHVFLNQLSTPYVTEHVEDFRLSERVVLGFYNRDRALAVYPRTSDGGGIGYVDFGSLPTSPPCSIYYQHIPPNMDVQEVCLSPDGTRLAWKFTVKPLPLGLRATINSNYVHRSSPDIAGLWVSALDCSNLHAVGTVDIRDDHISNLRWTPDSKRLSFIYSDSLYTVPAD